MPHTSPIADLAPSPAAYLAAARQVRDGAVPGLRPVKLAVLSTFTAEMLAPYLTVESARRGLAVAHWIAPWGQLEDAALGSEMYAAEPDAVLILARLEELLPTLTFDYLAMTEACRRAAVAGAVHRICALAETIRGRTAATLFIANFVQPNPSAAGLADPMLPLPEAALVQEANAQLPQARHRVSDVFLFDFATTAAVHGMATWTSRKLQHTSRMPLCVTAQIATARSFARHLRAALVPPAKVLVLDLDNTLWGGVLGEDGVGGIALGDEYPGSVYKEFQRYLRTLRQRGVLLAIASKNNEADVEEVFARHADMVLKRDDFSAQRIGWESKSEGIRAMADTLGLGLDTFVFFDDSAFEREEVRGALPDVRVVEPPSSPLGFVDTLEDCGHFDRLVLSAEDAKRTQLYHERAQRAAHETTASTREEFLAGLGLVATIGAVGPDTLPRVAQLLAKTNQFNLTTRRHTAAELEKMIASGAVALWLRLADKFGDHGLTGFALALPAEDTEWRVDSLLLSCRVIGRGAETALLATLAAEVAAHGARTLIGEFCPTERNAQVATFYPAHGFSPAGEHLWRAGTQTDLLRVPPFIEVRRA